MNFKWWQEGATGIHLVSILTLKLLQQNYFNIVYGDINMAYYINGYIIYYESTIITLKQ